MASRITHLVISKLLANQVKITNLERFNLGSLITDAIEWNNDNHVLSHYKTSYANNRIMIDYSKYKEAYHSKIEADDLYLGYLFHLVSDAVYRLFMNKIDFIRTDFFVDELHNDYRVLNKYLIDKYNLVNDIKVPSNFETETINDIYIFRVDEILSELNGDFELKDYGNTKHLTEKLIDHYIELAVETCINIYRSMSSNIALINPERFSWKQNVG